MLNPYRVLDLSDERGLLCGQILADLGAEVIAVESPGGNPVRHTAPFAGDDPDPERSLAWWAYARGKRSIVLDLEEAAGRARFLEWVRGADILIESFDPGRMEALGLGYEALARENPALVYVSISAFGQDGPKAGYLATDLTLSAAAGVSTFLGDDDRAPLRIGVAQAFKHAAAEAAGAALIALFERKASGLGQHVDVSAQQAYAMATENLILTAANDAREVRRVRGGAQLDGFFCPMVWECKDGFVSFFLLGGAAIGPFCNRMLQWIHEEGECDAETAAMDWTGEANAIGGHSPDAYRKVIEIAAGFLESRTKAELVAAALERRLLIAPMATMGDLLESPQFAARDFWHDVEHAGFEGQVRHPGAFARLSERPLENWRPAPRLGELDASRAPPPLSVQGSGSTGAAPLAGLKVLDLTWAVASPAALRVLSDYGATVVKVETASRPDTARTVGPFPGGRFDLESAVLYHGVNAGKLGLSLDLSTETGRDVFLDLVRWADVVVESLSPRVMRGWGLDYEKLRAVKPDLIMLSSTLFGQDGPLANLAGFGTMAAALAGFNSVTGWPDREPTMVLAYTDYIAPRFIVASLLAALDHRERSGQGQHIDLSQAEASLQLLVPEILDCAVNGRETGLRGNRDSQRAPHGTYRVAGEDRWVAIAIEDDAQWRALCDAMGRSDLGSDRRYADLEKRLAAADELDGIIEKWTSTQSGEGVERALQARGVPAHVVHDSASFVEDPQLRARDHFVRFERPGLATMTVENSRARLSRTPGRPARPAPTFGRDNQKVLSELLGYDDERIESLKATGALG